MCRSTTSVANALLYYARQRGQRVDHLKLQKLMYFVHVCSLVQQGQSQLEERPEAWPYGPIFNSLYYRLEELGTGRVEHALRELDPETGQFAYLLPADEDDAFWSVVKVVWDEYGHLTSRELSVLARAVDSPWAWARDAKALQIPDEFILDCYGAAPHEHAEEHDIPIAA